MSIATWMWVLAGIVVLLVIVIIIAGARRTRPTNIGPSSSGSVVTDGTAPRRGVTDEAALVTNPMPARDADDLMGLRADGQPVTLPPGEVPTHGPSAVGTASDGATVADPEESLLDAGAFVSADVQLEDDTPQYADTSATSDIYGETDEDEVPRDDMGRRLDPYGNPVEEGPGFPPFLPPGLK